MMLSQSSSCSKAKRRIFLCLLAINLKAQIHATLGAVTTQLYSNNYAYRKRASSNITMSSQENGRRIIRTALLTVGSTEFTALVQSALSEAVLQELQAQGCGRFIVQHGKSRLTGNGTEIVKQWSGRMIIELYEFIGDIEERMKGADLVLSHAG